VRALEGETTDFNNAKYTNDRYRSSEKGGMKVEVGEREGELYRARDRCIMVYNRVN
jgi:hypothetical protein